MGLRQDIERFEMTKRINYNRNQAIKQMKRVASKFVKEIVMLRWQVRRLGEEVRNSHPPYQNDAEESDALYHATCFNEI